MAGSGHVIQMVRKYIRFYGRVQGVGFRYHSTHAARALGLTGWVKNEYDGSVSMEVQGEPELINMLLKNLNSDMYIDITSMDSKTIPVDEEERSFSARH